MNSIKDIGHLVADDLHQRFYPRQYTLEELHNRNLPVTSLLFVLLPNDPRGQLVVTEAQYITHVNDIPVKPPHFVLNGGVYTLLEHDQYDYWYVVIKGAVHPVKKISGKALLENLLYKLKHGNPEGLLLHRISFLSTPTTGSHHAAT